MLVHCRVEELDKELRDLRTSEFSTKLDDSLLARLIDQCRQQQEAEGHNLIDIGAIDVPKLIQGERVIVDLSSTGE